MSTSQKEPGAEPTALAEAARQLALAADRASLATRLARGDQPGLAPGHPYVSLVLLAWEPPFRPLLLLSSLADHARNLAADPSASLLIDGTAGLKEPLAGPRVTLLGQVEKHPDQSRKARFVERHPGAARYAAFADFALYAMRVERVHFVAGFGRIAWLPAP
ncbi:MAG TPA: pyridoxamine 5'-phosphate oxidase family protein [Kiloniellales bacterium]|nr:pyridoxamine 5'-phosphate oxidase family protein [Kiloniellales bacterium]